MSESDNRSASEARLASILETAPDAIITIDERGARRLGMTLKARRAAMQPGMGRTLD